MIFLIRNEAKTAFCNELKYKALNKSLHKCCIRFYKTFHVIAQDHLKPIFFKFSSTKMYNMLQK